PEYHGETVDFPAMMTWPKPVQKPYPPVIVGGGFPQAARRAVRYGDGWIPNMRGNIADTIPQFKQMLADAGRSLAEVPITLFGVRDDANQLKRFREVGVARVVAPLPPEPADKILPLLDNWAQLIRTVNS